MIALIDLYQKELLKVNGFSPSTVETYLISIKAFCGFAKKQLKLELKRVKGPDVIKWLEHVKHLGIGYSRLENHHYAIKSFFGFLQRCGHIRKSPVDTLPLLIHRRRNRSQPIGVADACLLLNSFDRSTWLGLRNYTMVALFWALGLRTSELTGLLVGHFEAHHGKRVGLLRIRGKNKKQRALFVVDRLYDTLVGYLAHPLCAKKKSAAMFPGAYGKRLSNNRVQRIVKEQGKAVGIAADVTPRVLRHCFATEMYHQKVPLSAIQAMMGHASKAETSIYIHVSDKQKELALDAIAISGKMPWQ